LIKSNFYSYVEKAAKDLELFTKILHEILAERGLFKESIKNEDIKMFCQNA
jgi:hypothetical protein